MAQSPASSASRMRLEETGSPSSSTGATASTERRLAWPSSFSTSTLPPRPLAEGEILAGDDARGAGAADQIVGDEIGRGDRGELGAEMVDQHRVRAGLGEQALALVEAWSGGRAADRA